MNYQYAIILAVYNEVETLTSTVKKIISTFKSYDYLVVLSHNGPNMSSWKRCKILSDKSNIYALHDQEIGIGTAYHQGMRFIWNNSRISDNAWILFWAADLPFEFTDWNAFNKAKDKIKKIDCFIGSKNHEDSIIDRAFIRTFMTKIFNFLTLIVLGLKTKDPQGSFFVKNTICKKIVPQIENKGFLFTTELAYRLEKDNHKIIELPIVYNDSLGIKRSSTIKPFKDGFQMLKSLLRFRLLKTNKNK